MSATDDLRAIRKAVESLNAAAARDLERATQMGSITVAQSRRDAFAEVLALFDRDRSAVPQDGEARAWPTPHWEGREDCDCEVCAPVPPKENA